MEITNFAVKYNRNHPKHHIGTDEYEDLYSYNSNPIHDMYLDNHYNINTGEPDDSYGDNRIDEGTDLEILNDALEGIP